MKEKKLDGKKIIIIISVILFIITLIINWVTYKKLPDQVGIHMNNSGEMDNYISKILFIFLTPIILMGINIYTYVFKEEITPKGFLASLIIFIANIWIIFVNIGF